jgi:aminomethyltransferase
MKLLKSILADYYPEGVSKDCIYPEVYTSLEEEYEAVRQSVGLIDGGKFGLYKITGEDATDYLHDLTTKEIHYLNPGMTCECLMLNEEAQALGMVYVQRFDEYYIVIIPPEDKEKIKNWMDNRIHGDIEITDMLEENAFLFVEGRKAWQLVKHVTGDDIESLLLRASREIGMGSGSIWITRLSRSGEYGYAVMGQPEAVTEFADKCFASKQFVVKICGSRVMDVCMLEIRQVNLHYETMEKGNVFELAQQWLIGFEKDSYIGYEKLKELFKMPKKSLCVGFTCDKEFTVNSNDRVFLEDEEVGSTLYTTYSPGLDKKLGIVKLKDDLAVSGISLTLKNSIGETVIDTISSPFLRPLSWDEPME